MQVALTRPAYVVENRYDVPSKHLHGVSHPWLVGLPHAPEVENKA